MTAPAPESAPPPASRSPAALRVASRLVLSCVVVAGGLLLLVVSPWFSDWTARLVETAASTALGEDVLIPTAPALLNAIKDATGVRLYSVPATPSRVRMALKEAGYD